jgi:transposase
MTTLVDRLVSDELWAIVEPLLRPHPAHPTATDTAPSLLATALPQSSTWRALLPGGGCCPPRNWGAGRRRPPGVALPSGPGRACSRPCTWTFSTGWASRAGWTGRAPAWTRPACAPSAGDHVGANPVDRGKPGSKMQLVCQGSGLPLTAAVTAANIADVTMLAAMVDDIAPVRTQSGRPRHRPGKLDADKGYDSAANRAWLRRRGIRVRIARRGIESSQRLGRHRWRVERALSWLSCYRRLAVRWARDSERFFAFVLPRASPSRNNARSPSPSSRWLRSAGPLDSQHRRRRERVAGSQRLQRAGDGASPAGCPGEDHPRAAARTVSRACDQVREMPSRCGRVRP